MRCQIPCGHLRMGSHGRLLRGTVWSWGLVLGPPGRFGDLRGGAPIRKLRNGRAREPPQAKWAGLPNADPSGLLFSGSFLRRARWPPNAGPGGLLLSGSVLRWACWRQMRAPTAYYFRGVSFGGPAGPQMRALASKAWAHFINDSVTQVFQLVAPPEAHIGN